MPASLVVQLALWPDEIAPWARGESTSESLVYNMLARRKPYLRVRERLAERLEVPPAVLAHLVDARRPLPAAKREPGARDAAAGPGSGEDVDWSRPPYPPVREGSNPIERRAIRVVERDVASMPASAVVGLALWPTTLAEWSREHRLKSSLVWATLAGSPSERVRADLAARLDVTRRDLDDLIAATRAQPGAARTPELLADRSEQSSDLVAAMAAQARRSPFPTLRIGDESRDESGDASGGDSSDRSGADVERRGPPPPSPAADHDQLSLGF